MNYSLITVLSIVTLVLVHHCKEMPSG